MFFFWSCARRTFCCSREGLLHGRVTCLNACTTAQVVTRILMENPRYTDTQKDTGESSLERERNGLRTAFLSDANQKHLQQMGESGVVALKTLKLDLSESQ